jgi:membrane-associated protease RseP (regulator of RpoE activity)
MVHPGSPAEEAGLRRGDEIVQVDRQPIRSFRNLLSAIREKEPGERAKLVVIRNGAEQTLDVVLDSVREALAESGYLDEQPDGLGPPVMDHDQLAELIRGLESDIQILTREVQSLKEMLNSDPERALDPSERPQGPPSDQELR